MFKRDKQSYIGYLFNVTTLLTVIKQAFEIKKGPFPWSKAISAAICAGFPVFIGLVVGQLQLGLLGGIGSFSYLYVFNEPYAQRAKKMFFVVIGISLSVALGTLAAPHPVLVVLLVGLIGSIATFIFGVLKIPGPAAIFFVLSFIMTTGMPLDPASAPIRTTIVLLSGLFAWMISMVGWLFNPHDPEIKALREVYLALVEFSEAIGGENNNNVRHRTVIALKESQETLSIGYIPWNNQPMFNRLLRLNEQANKLFIEMLELSYNRSTKLPGQISEMIKRLSMGIGLKDGESITIDILPQAMDHDYHDLVAAIHDIETIINEPLNLDYEISVSKSSLKMKLTEACDKDSIVFINAIRYGVILSISTLIAFNFSFARPYWIPLSCAAVMLGSTIMSTFYRAIQRSCGTIIGLIVAILILSMHPQGFMIVITIMCLTALTELLIVKNYALAAVFITPNALLLAKSSTQIYNVSYFATARIIDIVIGSVIGLIGTYLMGHRSASSRLPDLMVKLIHSQSQVLIWLASNGRRNHRDTTKWIKEKMEINLVNFKMAYVTALGEIFNNDEMLEIMWPAVFSFEHISYLLEQNCIEKGYLRLADEDLAQLLLILDTMAAAIEQKQSVIPRKIPVINEIPKICHEINTLQEILSIKV